MGRQESALDPGAGPVQRFAFELRKLRQEAGGITYRAMARGTDYSLTTLSRAAAGSCPASCTWWDTIPGLRTSSAS